MELKSKFHTDAYVVSSCILFLPNKRMSVMQPQTSGIDKRKIKGCFNDDLNGYLYKQYRDLVMHVICFPICSCLLLQNDKRITHVLCIFNVKTVQIFVCNCSSLRQKSLSNWPFLVVHLYHHVSLIYELSFIFVSGAIAVIMKNLYWWCSECSPAL